jgi:hypothetical protein
MQQSQEPTQIEINFSPNGPSASDFVVETQTNLVNVALPWHPIDCRDAAHEDTALYRTPRTIQWHPAHRIHRRTQKPSTTYLGELCCMGNIYTQLSLHERTMIHTQLEMGLTPAAIAGG